MDGTQTALVLFAHGSRDMQWAEPFAALKAQIEAVSPHLKVRLAFLERMTPALLQALEALAVEGVRKIVVAPVFLAQGGHVKRDLPLMIDAARQRYPAIEIVLLPPVGEMQAVIAAMARAVLQALDSV